MMLVQYLLGRDISLNKALDACVVAKQERYWKKKARESKADPSTSCMIRHIRERRPRYGTRRVAAELSRQLGKPVNRKANGACTSWRDGTGPRRPRLMPRMLKVNKGGPAKPTAVDQHHVRVVRASGMVHTNPPPPTILRCG